MASPGVAFALALDALLVGAGLVLVGYWWLTRAGDANGSDPVADWYEEAASLAREVQRVADASGPVADHDRVQRRLVPLSERIKGHARSAPAGVEEHLVEGCYGLGIECYGVGMEHTTLEAARTGEFLEDKLDALAASAGKFEAAIPQGPPT